MELEEQLNANKSNKLFLVKLPGLLDEAEKKHEQVLESSVQLQKEIYKLLDLELQLVSPPQLELELQLVSPPQLDLELGGGAWPFLVDGAICLVKSDNDRDSGMLNSYAAPRDLPWELQLAVVYATHDLAPSSPKVALNALESWKKDLTKPVPPAVSPSA
ncbi:hypothetical protein HF521_017025 [Silurus meridionalis]|uniref:Little elongation complex subunit 1 C-terminal domain-containing protein n=1 Tax=Silurus meridionalis TaxID=175797 RepID=A0A8T0BLK7_SILME|nr:hypothetical protein HF521_017025 [Silurus meridionalis]